MTGHTVTAVSSSSPNTFNAFHNKIHLSNFAFSLQIFVFWGLFRLNLKCDVTGATWHYIWNVCVFLRTILKLLYTRSMMPEEVIRQKIKLAAESEMTRRGNSWKENIWWCRKGRIKQSSMEDGGASHLRERPLIIHGAISSPIEGENHHCENESCTYFSSFFCLLLFPSWNLQPFLINSGFVFLSKS